LDQQECENRTKGGPGGFGRRWKNGGETRAVPGANQRSSLRKIEKGIQQNPKGGGGVDGFSNSNIRLKWKVMTNRTKSAKSVVHDLTGGKGLLAKLLA